MFVGAMPTSTFLVQVTRPDKTGYSSRRYSSVATTTNVFRLEIPGMVIPVIVIPSTVIPLIPGEGRRSASWCKTWVWTLETYEMAASPCGFACMRC